MAKFLQGNYIESGKKIKIEEDISFTAHEVDPVLMIEGVSHDGVIYQATFNIGKLKKILHEWKLMKKVGKPVEVEILDIFSASEGTLAVAEIKKILSKRSQASIHRALNNLVKKNLLVKPGRGTYRRTF